MTNQPQAQQPADANAQARQGQIQIKASDEKLKGEYANVMRVHHTKEEFVLDFLGIFEQQGTLNSRIVVSHNHMKRMLTAIAGNVAKYEAKFGTVEASEAPANKIGFQG